MKDKDDAYWRKKLTPEQYQVMRLKGTEPPFSGKILKNKESGAYNCAACGSTLFDSKRKYDSRTLGLEGWPSFSDVAKSDAVELSDDYSFGMHRIEINCKNCGGHLGHVFEGDKSSPTGKHYCVNSCALDFEPKK